VLIFENRKKELQIHRSYRPFAFTLNSQKDAGADNQATCKHTTEIQKDKK